MRKTLESLSRTTRVASLAAAYGACVCAVHAGEPALVRFELSQRHMGAAFRMVLYASDENSANVAATAAFARIAEIDARLSDYKPDSELNQLCNRTPTRHWTTISPDLCRVLLRAQRLAKDSDGAFDVTVGPYTRLWRRARRTRRLPAAGDLKRAGQAVGYRYVELRPCDRTARLLAENMQLDLGGIAKGFATDEALAVLRQHGIKHALVDGSGDMALGAAPPDKQGWRIGVAPLSSGGPPSRVLNLANCAVATSGDAWQYLEIGDVRYSHIVDPKTGLGLTTPLSVTVVAGDGMTADALASTLSVLGPQKGFPLIERSCDTAALIVRGKGDNREEVETFESKRFAALTDR